MKALLMTGFGKIEDNTKLTEIEKPVINNKEVLIEVHAAGVNPVDYKIIGGAFKQISKTVFPAPLGFDVSGIVVESGSEVTRFSVGDEVFSRVSSEKPGTFAEYIAVDSSVVVKKPDNISFVEASSIPLVGETTVQAFDLGNVKKGDSVLIHAGSGGVGSFAIQYAKSLGATVFTTTSTKNVEFVKELGADRVIDYKKENYLDIVKDVDFVYDTLGHNYTADSFKVLKSGGTVVSISGDIDSTTALEFGLPLLVRGILALKRRNITKAAKKKSGTYRFLLMKPNGDQLEKLAQLLKKGSIKPIIDRTFPLDQAVSALQYQEKGRARGKVIISIK